MTFSMPEAGYSRSVVPLFRGSGPILPPPSIDDLVSYHQSIQPKKSNKYKDVIIIFYSNFSAWNLALRRNALQNPPRKQARRGSLWSTPARDRYVLF